VQDSCNSNVLQCPAMYYTAVQVKAPYLQLTEQKPHVENRAAPRLSVRFQSCRGHSFYQRKRLKIGRLTYPLPIPFPPAGAQKVAGVPPWRRLRGLAQPAHLAASAVQYRALLSLTLQFPLVTPYIWRASGRSLSP
jgi:hypothetical protein